MRLARFLDPSGAVRRGEWLGGGVEFGGDEFDLDEVELLPPCRPSKIVCVGLNYRSHAEELDRELPDRPMLFLKPPNAVAPHGASVELPEGKERVDYEAELGVVIGEGCRNVEAGEAMEHVEGYTPFCDLSNRDDQRREQNWVRGKAFDGAAPMGPCVATPDEVPEGASVELRLNGDTRQSSSVDDLIFSVPELIEEITRYMTLEPGDVIATGTPAGVGPLEPGDEVEVEVEGAGVLEFGVRG